MAASSSGNFWILTAIAAVPAAIVSFVLERRRKARMPDTLPFTWGYYIGLNSLFLGAILVLLGVLVPLLAPAEDSLAGVVVIGAVYIAAGYGAIRRTKIGFVATTILSLNIFWMVANAIYARNRWVELGRRAEDTSRPNPKSAETESQLVSADDDSDTMSGTTRGMFE
jgi:uncharacterized membrane protein